MSFNFHRKSPLNITPIMDAPVPQSQSKSRAYSFIKGLHVLGLVCLILSLAFVSLPQGSIYAYHAITGQNAQSADQGSQGIKGYVVGGSDVSAYACPDVNTAKCPVKLTLKPGTQVIILDNVIGANVPGLNDNAWRKIAYQGQVLFVPMHYISVTPATGSSSGNTQDVSFVQTSNEDDSTTPQANPGGFSIVPAGRAGGIIGCHTIPCPPPICLGGTVMVGFFRCCPQGSTFVPNAPGGAICVTPPPATFYHATDGRIDGNAGDRIAIYCRRTGRIEVWSINNSQGHFLVEFDHHAVDLIGRVGLSVNVGGQGVVTIGGDGHGQYWVSLFGGAYNATGAGDFAKIFHCYV